MNKVVIKSTAELNGSVKAPPSKAYTHRALIAASLSDGESEIVNPSLCDDTMATVNAIRAYGATLKEKGKTWIINGSSKLRTPDDVIHCGESASTLRFVAPVVANAPGISILTGEKSLRRRPVEPLLTALKQLGVKCYSTLGNGRPPIVIFGGGVKGGAASMPGDVSSQFVSGLLFASPMAMSSVEIVLTTPLESRPYVNMTLEVLRKHGIKVEVSENMTHYNVPNSQSYRRFNHNVPGDYSSAAFMLAAAAITSSRIRVTNLERDSSQGDKAIVDILADMGAKVKVGNNYVEVEGGYLKGIHVNASDTPDLVPVCAALGCYADGETLIHHAKRLRIKESDRISSLSSELRKMGAKITATNDGLKIVGPCRLHGATVDPHHDHRVAMACAIAALKAKGKTRILNPECVNKSYPKFFRDLKSLGVEAVGG